MGDRGDSKPIQDGDEMQPPHQGSERHLPPLGNPAPTSGLAVASLVFGIIGLLGSWFLLGIPSITAIVLGHAATGKTKRGIRPGHGMAVAGLVLGYVVVVPAFLFIGFLVLTRPQALAELVNTGFSWLSP
ncbi:DUF4190 domain-containing protein [Nonomuraea sp. NPDC050451]|uniref:DUF4190 domain-containing protein n=1 Tax=Nonomuraea sp. NPDC050451 TaxID=3364364 RepID=UPI00379B294E